MTYQLYTQAARRYDLHTPPHRFERSHRFVAAWLREQLGSGAAVLDVGCGTGSFLQQARAVGLEAEGLDAAAEMVAVAEGRVGPGVVRVGRMQELADVQRWGAVVALGWVLNYCRSLAEAEDVLRRFYRALRPGGAMVLQLAHAAHASGHWEAERLPGPAPELGDVVLGICYAPLAGPEPRLRASFHYSCLGLGEEFEEEHLLHAADAWQVAARVRETGFEQVELFDSWAREPFTSSASPLLIARRPAE